MGELEDDKREIMDAVKNAIAGAVNQHMLLCPMAQNVQEHERIRIDLYNGEDGKSGLVYEFRDFFSTWRQRIKDEAAERARLAARDKERRRNSQWRTGIVAVAILALLGFLGRKAWDQITILNRLEDDWVRYYAQPPATPPVPLTPQSAPKIQHKSFWQQPHASVKSHQQAPPQYAGAEPTAP